jgi:hypothetical protein
VRPGHVAGNATERIQPAGHAAENDSAATESVGEQRRDQSGVDFANAGRGQHDAVPVELTDVKVGVGDLVVLAAGQDCTQMRQLLRDGTDDADRHRTIV